MADKKSGSLKGFYVVLGATAAITLGTVGWSALRGGLSSAATEPIMRIAEGEIESLEWLVETATGIERGNPDAPITIMEFADFQCPSCQQFATFVKPQIDLAYVEEGLVRFVFHDFPLASVHRYAFLAARGARCALDQGEEYFWPFHDQLFSHQSTWSLSPSPPMNAFESYAAAIGLDADEFTVCLDSDRHAEVVSANMRLGVELGVFRTPTIFASTRNGMAIEIERWNEFEGFESVIDRLLEGDDAGGN